uniref:NIMA related kinase 3 n=1 Tax=Callorhinchus milii TaxID=7868 RepID=A0A4W3K1L3_CALMI
MTEEMVQKGGLQIPETLGPVQGGWVTPEQGWDQCPCNEINWSCREGFKLIMMGEGNQEVASERRSKIHRGLGEMNNNAIKCSSERGGIRPGRKAKQTKLVLECRCVNARSVTNKEIVEASPNITKWNSTEGENVAKSLAQKPLEQTVSQMEVTPKGDQVIMFKDSAPNIHMRKQWKEGPSNTVLNVLENAQLTSSGTAFEETKSDQVTIYATNKPRKLWNPGPPEAVLNFLKNANLSLAFKTYSIDKPASGTYLIGPLSADSTKAADNVDGEMETIEEDPERLEPRSDDEDTEFEDDSDPDWVEELKKMVENTL